MLKMNPSAALILCPPFWHQRPPLGLAFLESTLLSAGIPYKVFDWNIEFFKKAPKCIQKLWLSAKKPAMTQVYDWTLAELAHRKKEMIDELTAFNANHYCFSIYAANRKPSLRIIDSLKRQNGNAKIIAGGPQILFDANDYKSESALAAYEHISHIVAGEGEKPLEAILKSEANQRFISHQEHKNLDHAPYPQYLDFPLSDYLQQKTFSILFSRGCLRRCSFCSERLLSSRFRMRTPENVIEEIEGLQRKYDARNFVFHDSLINGDPDKLERFCDLIIRRDIRLKWEGQLMIRRNMTLELFQKMKKSGCYNVFIGLESGSDRTLKFMNKGFDSETASGLLKKLKQAGLHCEISLITDYPGESEENFCETLEFLSRNQAFIPKIAQVNPAQILPGTCLYRNNAVIEKSDRLNRLIEFLDKKAFKYTPAFLENLDV